MRNETFALFFVISFIFIFGSCGNNSKSNNEDIKNEQTSHVTNDTAIVKIYVNKDGQVKANGKTISLEGLDSLLNNMQSKTAVVYYSRYNAQEYEGPKESLKVLDLVIKYELPLKFYTDSTFNKVAPLN